MSEAGKPAPNGNTTDPWAMEQGDIVMRLRERAVTIAELHDDRLSAHLMGYAAALIERLRYSIAAHEVERAMRRGDLGPYGGETEDGPLVITPAEANTPR